MTAFLLFCVWLAGAAPQAAAPGDVIADVRVHGNHVTADAEVIRLSGLVKGAPFTNDTIPAAKRLLEKSGKFDDVQVLKRFASIDDPSQIVVMLVVNEGAVRIELPDMPSGPTPADWRPKIVKRTFGQNVMWFPILDQEDGYSPRFGVRFAYVPSARSKSRLSMPLTWGGERRAGLEWEKGFDHGRLQVGGALTSTKHPYYDERDGRRRAWARLEGTAKRLHVGGTATLQRINFGGNVDQVKTIGADATFDTRLDPVLPRNAIHVFASAEQVRLTPDQGPKWDPYVRRKVDASVYLGTIKQAVLVGRVVREDATASQPLYFKPMLGGMNSLRGYETASFVGDTLVAGTLELRVPLTSPISVGKFGVRTFIDRGTVYDRGQRFKDQDLKQGYGGGIFFALPTFSMNLDLAYSSEKNFRLHFSGGFSF